MNQIKIIYVAGALRGNFIQYFLNKKRAKRIVHCLWMNNIAVYSPHCNSGWINGKNDVFIMRANIEMLIRCDAMFVLDGWEKSSGTKDEIEVALKKKLPIYFNLSHLIKDVKSDSLKAYDIKIISGLLEGV